MVPSSKIQETRAQLGGNPSQRSATISSLQTSYSFNTFFYHCILIKLERNEGKKKNKADFVDGDYSPGEALNICEQQQQKKNRRQKKQVARNGMFAVKNIVR